MLIPCVTSNEIDDNASQRKRIDKLVIGGPLKDSFVHITHTDKEDKENDEHSHESPIVQNSISIRDAQLRASQMQQEKAQAPSMNLVVSDEGSLPRSASSVGRLASVRRKPVPRLSSKGELMPSSSNMQLAGSSSTNATYRSADFAPPAIAVTASAQ